MLKKPYRTSDTLSRYNLNLPFEMLHVNFIFIERFVDSIDLGVKQDSLYGKSVRTDGIGDLVGMDRDTFVPVAPEKITLRSSHYKKHGNTTALRATEIEEKLAESAAQYRHTFKQPIGSSAVPSSNLITLGEASAAGYRRGATVSVYDIDISAGTAVEGNMLLPPRIVEDLFFAKGRRYSIVVANELIESIHADDAFLGGIEAENYARDDDPSRVPMVDESDGEAIGANEGGVLFMRFPNLLSPATKEAFSIIAQDFVDMRHKDIERIRIERDRELEDSDVLTVGEAESMAREAFGRIGRITFDSIREFENFLDKVCDPESYLPKNMEVDHFEGYAETRFDTMYATMTHKGFSRLLRTKGRISDASLVVDRASLYFSNMDPERKERLIRIAQAAGLELDFTMDTAGQVFDTLCKLALLLSYPTPQLLEDIRVAIKEGQPLRIGPLTIVPPVLQAIRAVFVRYAGFVRPIYIPRHIALVLLRPFLQVRSGVSFGSHPFVKPLYVKTDEQLLISPPHIAVPKQPSAAAYGITTPVPRCSIDGAIDPYVNEFAHMYGKLHANATTSANMYAFFESSRAVNWRELEFLTGIIRDKMSEGHYICNNCVVSKDFAARIVALKILKDAVTAAKLPAHLDPKKNVKRIYSEEVVNTAGHGESAASRVCSAAGYSMPISGEYVYHVQTAVIEPVDDCQPRSEILHIDIDVSPSFILEETDISGAVQAVSGALAAYYARFDKSVLSSGITASCYFGDDLSATIDMVATGTCDMFFAENIKDDGVDTSYMRDLIANRALGSADNKYPCRSHTERALLEYYTFVTIYGEGGDKPTTYEEQRGALSSEAISKLYYIPDELLVGGGTVHADALKFFYKRKKTYIATIGHRRTFTYLDPSGIVYSIGGNVNASLDGEYVVIGSAKIKLDDMPQTIEVRAIDTDMTNFDFSFLRTLGMMQGIFMEPVPGMFVMSFDQQDAVPRIVIAGSFSYDDSEDPEVTSSESGADGLSKASISSPACESMVQSEIKASDFIPANYETFVRVRIANAKQGDNGLVVEFGDVAIPLSYGVIDGYYSQADGELLMNAATTYMAQRIYQQGGYEKHVYYKPQKRTTAASIAENGDNVRIELDYAKLSGKIVRSDGTRIEMDGVQRVDSLESIESPGFYIVKADVEDPIVRIKSVTKNKHYPIGILGGERYSQREASTEQEFAQLSQKYPIVVMHRESGVAISLSPAIVYSNGISMKFKEV